VVVGKYRTAPFLVVVLLLSLVTGSFPVYAGMAAETAASGGESGTYKYDFKLPVDSKIEDAGWEITDVYLPDGSFRHQVYGIQVQARNIGHYITIRFHVPETGFYTVQFNGAGAGSGSIASILIDGKEIGEYNFYSSTYIPEKGPISMGPIGVSQGVHQLTLKVKQKAGYYHMYPGEMILVKSEALPSLVSVQLASEKPELMAGQTSRLTVTGTLGDGSSLDLGTLAEAVKSFTSTDESIAIVDSGGIVKAVQPGTATIRATVTLNGVTKEADIPITVNDKILGHVSLTSDKLQISVGSSATLKVSGTLDDGTPVDLKDAEIVYRSLNESVATVDESGVVTARAKGKAAIHADVTLGGVTRSAELELQIVNSALQQLTARLYRTALFLGDAFPLELTGSLSTGEPADLSAAECTYESSDTQVATVDSGGIVHAVGTGTARITASCSLDGSAMSAGVEITSRMVSSSKTRSTYYTPAKIAAARDNIAKYEWAKNIRDNAVANADKFLALGYDYLWNMVTPQSLPRSYGVNQQLGSPITGLEINKYGNYPWVADPVNNPWKLTDPSSGYQFPTNDFGAYYQSGLDDHGIFRPELADRSLLVNTLYPDKGLDWGVDDGFGWVDENGRRWTFIAYYNHWAVWHGGLIAQAVSALRDAFIYTGDVKYARAGTILLDRIADVYPDMDISAYDSSVYLNSHGGTGQGKVVGSIWETGLVNNFISAYDAFFPVMDDPEISGFLSAKSDAYHLGVLKKSGTGIRRNIEDGIIRQVYPAVRKAQIRGNTGMHQSTLALAAVVLDTLPETKEWLDFDFQAGGLEKNPYRVTGGNILASLVDDVDRDGFGFEAAPGYNKLWLGQFEQIADILDGYDLYPAADLYQNVKFRKMFSAFYPLMLSDHYFPQIGDTGNTGGPLNLLDLNPCIKAFEKFGDPIFAQLVYFLNGNRTDGIHGDIFTPDPEGIAEKIAGVIERQGPLNLKSSNLTGYGFTALRDGVNTKRFSGLGLNFGKLKVTDATADYQLYANSGTLQFNAESANQRITFEFAVPKTDQYEIDLKPFKAQSYGIYDILIDGGKVARFDFFGSSGASASLETIANLPLAAGTHTITFTGAGKRDTATNYKMGVIQLQLYDKAAQEVKNNPANVNTQRDLWMYYGNNGHHGHRDTLNIGMHAFNLDLLPDLGYPEFADTVHPRRYEWENNTVSHNTVIVDETKQQFQEAALPRHYDDSSMVKLIDVEAPKVYPQTELYKRTTALIKVDDANSYAVDFFRVKGGHDHHFSFHSAEGAVTTEGLHLTAQPSGTYAGPDVPYGQRPEDDSVAGPNYQGAGFHYLKNVEKDTNPPAQFSVDWNVKDTWDMYGNGPHAATDVHLRLTMLGQTDDVALADGVPPTNKPGNPSALRYLIAHRSGDNLDSTFTSVIEPYRSDRFIEAIGPAPVTAGGQPADADVKAVKVVLKNGRTDYIISALHSDITYIVDGKFQFQGFFGVYSEKDGHQVGGYLNDGMEIGAVSAVRPAITGTVADFTKELSNDNQMTVQLNENAGNLDQLAGSYLYIDNDGTQNGSYRIEGAARRSGNLAALDLGDVTLIRSWSDANDFSKGFVYNIAEGAAFRIPLAEEIVDETPPETTIQVDGITGEGTFNGKDVGIGFSAADNPGGSGVKRTEYRINGGDWITVADSVYRTALNPDTASPEEEAAAVTNAVYRFTRDGIYNVQFRSEDRFGNVEETRKRIVGIDKTGPEIGEPDTLSILQTDSPSVYIPVSDPLSGVQEVSVTLDGVPAANPVRIAALTLAAGDHSLRVTASDKVGNSSEREFVLNVVIDTDHLDDLLNEGAVQGKVANRGVLSSLLAKVSEIQKADNRQQMLNGLNALGNEVRAQSGKAIDPAFADLILGDIALIRGRLDPS
jgi:uncharacterized protein YjdB